MATLKERVPKPARGPIGFLSLFFAVAGIAVGYIITLLGVTLFLDLNGLGSAITPTESLVVFAIGVAIVVVGYLGWRGFMYFAY